MISRTVSRPEFEPEVDGGPPLKEHVALDRTSWSLKSVKTVCYEMHMVRKII